MSRVATVYQGLTDGIGRRPGDPVRSSKSNKSIDLARCHTKRGCAMTPDKRCCPSQRRDDLRGWMPERSRWGIGIAVSEPRHASVTRDEILSMRRL